MSEAKDAILESPFVNWGSNDMEDASPADK
jgi:hypothetical protein